jgi:hypothetical protein
VVSDLTSRTVADDVQPDPGFDYPFLEPAGKNLLKSMSNMP